MLNRIINCCQNKSNERAKTDLFVNNIIKSYFKHGLMVVFHLSEFQYRLNSRPAPVIHPVQEDIGVAGTYYPQ
jgi:hypothetical protein